MRAAGAHARVVHRTSQLCYMQALVEEGSISFLPASVIDLFPALAFRRFEPVTYQRLVVVTRPYFTVSRRAKALIDTIGRAVSEG